MTTPNLDVLVVDDNPEDAQHISKLMSEFKGEGPHVRHAEHVSDMAAILAGHEFDAVLFGMSGTESEEVETLQLVRCLAPTSALIVLGEDDNECRARRALRNGAQDYLPKTELTPALLQQRLTHGIERSRAVHKALAIEAIVESSDDAVIGKTLEGTITSWNHGAERLYGYSAREAVGAPVSMLMPEEAKQALPEILATLRRGERMAPFETVRLRKGGAPLNVSVEIFPVSGPGGRIVGAGAIARNVTERLRAEADIRRSGARLRLIEDASDEIFWITNQQASEIFHISPTFERIFGRSRESVERDPQVDS